jgi:hypothetical protein
MQDIYTTSHFLSCLSVSLFLNPLGFIGYIYYLLLYLLLSCIARIPQSQNSTGYAREFARPLQKPNATIHIPRSTISYVYFPAVHWGTAYPREHRVSDWYRPREPSPLHDGLPMSPLTRLEFLHMIDQPLFLVPEWKVCPPGGVRVDRLTGGGV